MIWEKIENWEIEGAEVVFFDENDNEITRADINSVIAAYVEEMKELN